MRASVEIAAAPEAVFRALTDPTELPLWWGSADVYRTHDWKVDLRPGGKWSCQARSPQGDSEVRGEYLAIEPPRLLEYTWEPSWEQYRQTIIRCTLEPIPGGTRVSASSTGASLPTNPPRGTRTAGPGFSGGSPVGSPAPTRSSPASSSGRARGARGAPATATADPTRWCSRSSAGRHQWFHRPRTSRCPGGRRRSGRASGSSPG